VQAQGTAFVTGANGAIGRHVVQGLAQRGWRVHGIGHGAPDRTDQERLGLASWLAADVTAGALSAVGACPDLIIHCAGSSSVVQSVNDPARDFARTVHSVVELLEFVRRQAPKARIVLPSSAAVYGAATHLPIREDADLRPVSPYGLHKKIAEDYLRGHARFFGLHVAVVRLFSIYGEGFRKQLLWDACQRHMGGEPVFFGTGLETRDWLHVSDAASLLISAANLADPSAPVLNGGAGQAVTVRDMIERLGTFLGQGRPAEFTGSDRPGDPQHYAADISLAKASGWRPLVSLDEGLSRYAQWFLDGGRP